MAASVRFNVLNKQCFVITAALHRHFSICRVNRSPRGIAISERRRNILVEDEEVSHFRPPGTPRELGDEALMPSNRPPPKSSLQPSKDTRAIDSVDPVILKYASILQDMKSETPQEKVHSTNFGMIRFDNDNVPRVHGQFDTLDGPDRTDRPLVEKDTRNGDFNTAEPSEIHNTPTQLCQEPAIDPMPQDLAVKQNHGTSATPSEKTTYLTESERIFDELFGGPDDVPRPKALESNSFVRPQTERGHNSPEGKEVPGRPVRDTGFIDEQFFSSGILQREANVNDGNANFNTTQRDGYHGPLPIAQDLGSTSDLNFIDETYFKPSLDAIRENRKPPVEFSEIKEELENAFSDMSGLESSRAHKEDDVKLQLNLTQQNTSNIALSYLGMDKETESPLNLHPQKTKKQESSPTKEPPPATAYDFVTKKRREIHDSKFGFNESESPTSKGYEKILSLVNEQTVHSCTRMEMLSLLKTSIIYDANDIVGLYKPYGVTMHEGTSSAHHTLEHYLPELAGHLNAEELHMVHRLDAKTTGVLILARTPSMASTLKDMFKEQKITKTYWAITRGIPSPLYGTIDIPIAEGSINKKYRMVLRPDVAGFRGSTDKCHRAITGYRVLGKNVNSAWVEVKPITGVKHQIRVHLGFGLSCPVLGDHKYSNLKKLVPQKLPGDMLHRLKLEQSKVRDLPTYLHSRRILVPEIVKGRNVVIQAKIPAFFNKTLNALKLNTTKNKVRYDGSRCIDE
ncbi:uncharacterized protein LOC135213576 [Macrobrachium nipponense]|uniref:uncharacterized protein LOC135213576 n=1 Tax=Macrobrachium nipponense TaxID=159736 RepID=UPI0030C81A29